jgi:type IV pilus assembly protein PilC
MPTFTYEAMDSAGLEVKDTIEASSEAEAQTMIREKGFYVTKIREKERKKKATPAKGAKGGKREGKTFTMGGVKGKVLCTFTRQLSTLQDAGLPVLRSLRILEGQARPGALRNALIDVIEDVEGGNTLSEAMAKQPKAFDNLYVNMVRAGEAGGALEVILKRLAEFKEKAQSLKRKITGAMSFIMIFIIPKFKKIFEDFGVELPAMTVMLITMSDWMMKYWYFLFVAPITIWLFLKIVRKNKTGAFVVDWCSLRIPLIGKILHSGTIARVTRTLGTLIGSGVPILEGLLISRDTAGNAVFVRAFDNIYSAIREGETIAVPLKESRIVDDMVVNMVDVGEETGALDDMLYKVADVYDEEVEVRVEGLVSMLEPIMVVVLGLIVGFIVIALFLPLIKLLNDLS